MTLSLRLLRQTPSLDFSHQVDHVQKQTTASSQLSQEDKIIIIAVSCGVGGSLLVLTLLTIIFFIWIRRRRRQSPFSHRQLTQPLLPSEQQVLDYNTTPTPSSTRPTSVVIRKETTTKRRINLELVKQGVLKSCILDREGILIKSSIAKDLPRLVKKTTLSFNGREVFSLLQNQTIRLDSSHHLTRVDSTDINDINMICCRFLAELSKCISLSTNDPSQCDSNSSYASSSESLDEKYLHVGLNLDLQFEQANEQYDNNTSIQQHLEVPPEAKKKITEFQKRRKSTRMLINALNNVRTRMSSESLDDSSPAASQIMNIHNHESFSVFLRETFGEHSSVVNVLKLCSQTALFEGLNQIRPALLDEGIMFKDFRGKNSWIVRIITTSNQAERPAVIHERIEQVVNMQLQSLYTFTYQLEIYMDEWLETVNEVSVNLLSVDFSKSPLTPTEQEEQQGKIKAVFDRFTPCTPTEDIIRL